MSWDTLLTFIFASSILSIAPGPDNIFVLTQSALHGKRSGFFITLGLCTGLIIHTTAVALGLSAIFLVSATAFNFLKFIGAAYLLYLAWQALKTSNTSIKDDSSPALSAGAFYRQGIFMNLSNPKVAIFFLAFLPQFAAPQDSNLSMQLLLLGGIFIVVSLFIFCLISLLAGLISKKLKQSSTFQAIMNRITALVFFGLALRLATTSR